jgi:hypothetical protein
MIVKGGNNRMDLQKTVVFLGVISLIALALMTRWVIQQNNK